MSDKNIIAEDEISIFCEQIAMVLKSGVPLYEGLDAVCENYKDTKYEECFKEINVEYQRGSSFYDACKNAGVFPAYMLQMLNVGEKSGKLEDVMDNLSRFYDRESKISDMIKSAVLQPSIMMVVMGAVVLLLVVKVLPIFREVFRNLGAEFSETTNDVINVCTIIGIVVLALLLILIIVAFIFGLLLKSDKKQSALNAAGKILKPVNRVREKVATERFASVMAMMISSGYNLTESLEMSADIVEDEKYVVKIHKCIDLVNADTALGKALEEAELFDKLTLRMIQIGITTGQSDRAFLRISEIYANEVDTQIHNIISWIEPVLVAVMTVLVGAILLSVMLPLITIISNMG
ncbi:MAG: type II secretion system F family protein [Lachnospiraceae bacterium]|nr:type II secretion system F family protein [Lachnospiraceae bacterium]